MSRENVTGLLRRLQDCFEIKIENINLFKIIIKKTWKRLLFKTFAQIFSSCSKNLSCPKFEPPLPPGPYAYVNVSLKKKAVLLSR